MTSWPRSTDEAKRLLWCAPARKGGHMSLALGEMHSTEGVR